MTMFSTAWVTKTSAAPLSKPFTFPNSSFKSGKVATVRWAHAHSHRCYGCQSYRDRLGIFTAPTLRKPHAHILLPSTPNTHPLTLLNMDAREASQTASTCMHSTRRDRSFAMSPPSDHRKRPANLSTRSLQARAPALVRLALKYASRMRSPSRMEEMTIGVSSRNTGHVRPPATLWAQDTQTKWSSDSLNCNVCWTRPTTVHMHGKRRSTCPNSLVHVVQQLEQKLNRI